MQLSKFEVGAGIVGSLPPPVCRCGGDMLTTFPCPPECTLAEAGELWEGMEAAACRFHSSRFRSAFMQP